MSGTLYVVGTPIGNLSDITVRALETLKSVDFVAAEDTRVTLKLLTHFEIRKPLVSCHEHNAGQMCGVIADRIAAGESCAVVSDAGMPCISDPGYEVVCECKRRGLAVSVVPGPTAALSALAISGLPTKRFSFEGFLSVNKKQRYEHLDSICNDTRTLIFYEAPHKLPNTLNDLLDHLGDRNIALCRELTKIYEQVLNMKLSEAVKYYTENTPKGEFVLIVEGKTDTEETAALTLEQASQRVKSLIDGGMKPTDACREVAKLTGFKKGELYSAITE